MDSQKYAAFSYYHYGRAASLHLQGNCVPQPVQCKAEPLKAKSTFIPAKQGLVPNPNDMGL
jgi:hypothetical protein